MVTNLNQTLCRVQSNFDAQSFFSELDNEREKITSLFSVLDKIPEHNHATLERIIFHLARVAQQERTNLMSPNHLAIVFTPCFFCSSSSRLPSDRGRALWIVWRHDQVGGMNL